MGSSFFLAENMVVTTADVVRAVLHGVLQAGNKLSWYTVLSYLTSYFYTLRTKIHRQFSLPKFINIGPDLLEIFENSLGVR